MSHYMVIAVGIVSVMIVVVIAILMGSIIKGVRAGKTEIDIKIAGIFNMTILQTDVSKTEMKTLNLISSRLIPQSKH